MSDKLIAATQYIFDKTCFVKNILFLFSKKKKKKIILQNQYDVLFFAGCQFSISFPLSHCSHYRDQIWTCESVKLVNLMSVTPAPVVFFVKDADIFGMVVSGFFCGFILLILFLHFVIITHKYTINSKMRIFAALHLFSAFIFCFGAGLWRTDLIFTFNWHSLVACRLALFSQYVFYYLSKTFLYLLFIQRHSYILYLFLLTFF